MERLRQVTACRTSKARHSRVVSREETLERRHSREESLESISMPVGRAKRDTHTPFSSTLLLLLLLLDVAAAAAAVFGGRLTQTSGRASWGDGDGASAAARAAAHLCVCVCVWCVCVCVCVCVVCVCVCCGDHHTPHNLSLARASSLSESPARSCSVKMTTQ